MTESLVDGTKPFDGMECRKMAEYVHSSRSQSRYVYSHEEYMKAKICWLKFKDKD